MPHFPYSNRKVRAPRVRAQGERVLFCAEGKQINGKLHTFSPTGGLAEVETVIEETLAEIELRTLYGNIKGLVQVLPVREGPRWTAFSFVALSDDDHSRLCAALTAMRTDVPQPTAKPGRT